MHQNGKLDELARVTGITSMVSRASGKGKDRDVVMLEAGSTSGRSRGKGDGKRSDLRHEISNAAGQHEQHGAAIDEQ